MDTVSQKLPHCRSHLGSAVQILQSYDGSIPFSHYIKNYFSKNKKFGSKDRKQISNLCYNFFRLGKSFSYVPVTERILLGLKFCNHSLNPSWQQIINEANLPLQPPANIFPWKNELSESIDSAAFEASFLVQPDLFLRIRPGFEKEVIGKLKTAETDFSIDGTSVRLRNTEKVDALLAINKEVVVQDLSSQKIAAFLELSKEHFPKGSIISVYDCCAASGGKSILAKDVLKQIDLTVSDIRPSIIANLKNRFQQAGITNYKSFVQDFSKEVQLQEQYDLVIADVPCTGSGTWARTPEQLYFFENENIRDYAALQTSILQNAIKAVKPGGLLLYITCSVFKKENEDQLLKINEKGFSIVRQKTIAGYKEKADTMFGALMKRNLL